jgi:integrase
LTLGLGRETAETPVFGIPEGDLYSPDNLSRDWRRLMKSHSLPQVMFHALRHTHASALIASGADIVTVSRRLGHGSPNVTLTIYAHLFQKTDLTAASAIEATLRFRPQDA